MYIGCCEKISLVGFDDGEGIFYLIRFVVVYSGSVHIFLILLHV